MDPLKNIKVIVTFDCPELLVDKTLEVANRLLISQGKPPFEAVEPHNGHLEEETTLITK